MSFQDLKSLLGKLEEGGVLGGEDGYDIPFEIRERTLTLCRKFLGGTWKDVPVQDILIHRMKGGMSNMLFLCELPKEWPPRKEEPDKTLLRVYFNPETESHLVAESVIFTLLSERALGPQLFGIFNGGRLEEYIVSRPLTSREIRDPVVSKRIGRKLARVHSLSVPIEKEPDYLIDALQRWVEHLLEVVGGKLRSITVTECKSGKDIEITQELIFSEINLIRFLLAVMDKRESGDIEVTIHPSECSSLRQNEGQNIHHINNNKAADLADIDCSTSVDEKLSAALSAINKTAADDEDKEQQTSTISISMQDVFQEFMLIKRCICRTHSPVVFCHNDLQEGNILLPRGGGLMEKEGKEEVLTETGAEGGSEEDNSQSSDASSPIRRRRSNSAYEKDLVLIDFEYSSYNYRAFDFANHFVEWSIDYTSKKEPFFTVTEGNLPNNKAQRNFFQAYLEGTAELENSDVNEITEEDVEKLMGETSPFIAVSHFFWGVWSLLQLEVSPVEFGFQEYGRARLCGYFKWRDRMMELLTQEPPPASPIASRRGSNDAGKPPRPNTGNLLKP